jgi:hypothetical protein
MNEHTPPPLPRLTDARFFFDIWNVWAPLATARNQISSDYEMFRHIFTESADKLLVPYVFESTNGLGFRAASAVLLGVCVTASVGAAMRLLKGSPLRAVKSDLGNNLFDAAAIVASAQLACQGGASWYASLSLGPNAQADDVAAIISFAYAVPLAAGAGIRYLHRRAERPAARVAPAPAAPNS